LIDVAIYGRTSTDLQEKEHTIDSQLDALRRYALEKGYRVVREYLDEGYSGAVVKRPGLDRLRDDLASGEFALVLIHSPDRLARRVVLQYLVLEELEKAGIKPEFLNCPVDDSPEGKMLLGMQGLFAEYERAKILERTRRGKLLRAREGALVGGHAPYGYRWVKRSDERRAHLVIVEYTAAVVRRMYQLLLEERATTWGIARTLTREEVPTARGAAQWQPMMVFRVLTNPAYKGAYRYRYSDQEQLSIPVPAIIEEETWEAAQSQLEQNRHHARRNNQRHQYLLRGLVRCPRCGGSYTGYAQHGSRGYRCSRTHWTVSSTGQRCSPGAIPAEPVEEAVWEAVKEAFQNPQMLEGEYRRRLKRSGATGALDYESQRLQQALKHVGSQEDRVTEAYVAGAMDLTRYKGEMQRLSAQRRGLEEQRQRIQVQKQQEANEQQALARLGEFCSRVGQGLENMTFEERQQFLRLVVEAITVDQGRIKVEAVVPPELDGKLCNVRGELVEPHMSRRSVLRQAQDERYLGYRL
jgi:site-specific DNA recombinase